MGEPTPVDAFMGAYLRQLRESRGLSCRALATHVSARERGALPVTLAWLERVVRCLDMTIRITVVPAESFSTPAGETTR